jgi:3-oxoacyl-[acyl-carrier protein] reductase
MALVEAAMPAMRAGGFGRIVNVVSTSVREPIANLMLSNAIAPATLPPGRTIAPRGRRDGVTVQQRPARPHRDRRLAQAYGSLTPPRPRPATEVPAAGSASPPRCRAAPSPVLDARGVHHRVALIVDGGWTRSI